MKKLLFSLALVSLFNTAFASVKIEEELFVMGNRPDVVKDLIQTGSVVIDHVSSEGFEIYGRKGLGKYLDKVGVVYYDMKSVANLALADYPTHAQITSKLQELASKYPNILKLGSIGKSVKGKDLWVMKISDNVNADEVEPEFKYISSMHGDEITGRELTVALIEDIALNYGSNAAITELVNNTEIFIMPSMNPDGSERKQRGNANGVDLNRNFPDISNPNGNTLSGREVENKAVMQFQASRKFSLSANFHGGTIVANYPWDSTYDRHPMDAFAQEISLVYAEHNPEMRASSEFPRGITNGADWYIVKGGMQDWSYFWYNDLQITIELSHAKYPSYSEIPGFYKSNRESMLRYARKIHSGAGFKFKRPNIQGAVTIRQVSPQVRNLGTFAFANSEFYKVLPEGEYEFVLTDKVGRSGSMKMFVDGDTVKSNGNYVSID